MQLEKSTIILKKYDKYMTVIVVIQIKIIYIKVVNIKSYKLLSIKVLLY